MQSLALHALSHAQLLQQLLRVEPVLLWLLLLLLHCWLEHLLLLLHHLLGRQQLLQGLQLQLLKLLRLLLLVVCLG